LSKYCSDILKYFQTRFQYAYCPKINIFNSHRKKILEEKIFSIHTGKKYWRKNVFLSFYCNIFLSQYCVEIEILCELGLISTIEVTGIKSITRLCKSNVVFSLCKNFKENFQFSTNLNIEPTKKARRTPALPRP